MLRFVYLCALFVLPFLLDAQTTMTFPNGCNFINAADPQVVTFFDPTPEANAIVASILKAGGIQRQSFSLVVGNVKNARATQKNGVRYVLYSQQFMEVFKQKSQTYWSAYFLLAHEIGHHVLNHDFISLDKNKSHINEFQADTFATRIMVNLGATYDETLAGINAFVKDPETSTHPAPSARAELIAISYRKWSAKRRLPSPSKKDSTGKNNNDGTINKVTIQLDESCFKHWLNIVSSAAAEIDDEKITVKFEIPTEYIGKTLKICFVSNDKNIIPGARTPGSLSGNGVVQPTSKTLTIVWNYRMDYFVDPRQVSTANLFRLYVFDTEKQPNKTVSYQDVIAKPMVVAGAGLVTWGVIEMSSGKKIYDNTYRITLEKQAYEEADNKYVRGQYIIIGGAILGGVGAWMWKKSADQKKLDRTIICDNALPRINIEPIFGSSDSMAAIGFRLKF